MSRVRYYLLDVVLEVRAAAGVVERFDRYYHRFRDPEACGLSPPAGDANPFVVEAEDDGDWTCCWAGASWPARGRDRFETLFGLVPSVVLAQSRRFHLIHAAALDADGAGCLFIGPSAVGKTTLGMGLRHRGWTMLSDEVGALCRTSGRLHPFPRAVHLRLESLALLGWPPPGDAPEQLAGESRWLFPAGKGRTTTFPRVVFLLEPPEAPAPDPAFDYLELALDQTPSGLSARLSELDAVGSVDWVPGYGAPRLRIGYRKGAGVIPELDRVLTDAGATVRGHLPGVHHALDYQAPPNCRAIGSGEGIRRLLGHLLVGASLGKRRPPAALAFELSALLREARYFRMVPGPLEASLDVIESVVAGGG